MASALASAVLIAGIAECVWPCGQPPQVVYPCASCGCTQNCEGVYGYLPPAERSYDPRLWRYGDDRDFYEFLGRRR